PYRFHLEFQRVLGPFPRFTHRVLLKLIFNHQLRSTFFGGKFTMELRRQTGEHHLIGSVTGNGQEFQESHRQLGARCRIPPMPAFLTQKSFAALLRR
ncbi:MAG: hypothetical protein KBG00_09655, partial [Rhodoferax sp.]|uniref:hypothetical protein n=1 Tax=Rhodoferax sp. TaxID=50421 RepID=UPI001B6AF9FB